MKKLFTLITAMVFFTAFANAQITHQFTVKLNTPADNSTMTYGDQYVQEFVIELTQGNIVPADTIAFIDPFVPQGQAWVLTGITKNQMDTIQVNRNREALFTPGTGNYCITAYKYSNGTFAPGFDSTGASAGTGTFRKCNSLTVNGWPTGVNDIKLNDLVASKLEVSVYPNPAIGNTIGMDYIARNSSDVEVNVFDLTGRKVISKSFGKAFKGQEGYDLDISALNTGMFILELRQDGIKATGQFVK